MLRLVSTSRPTGKTLFAFPDSGNLANYANGLGNRVAVVESAAPNLGRYTANLDDSVDTLWRVFEGATQPTSWSQSIEYFDLSGAESGSGQFAITFNVSDVNPLPVAYALVTIKQAGQIVAFQLTSNLGVARFNLAPGSYTYSISASGFTSVIDQPIVVSANATQAVSLTAQTSQPASTPSSCRVTIRATRNVANQATRIKITSGTTGRENERAFLSVAFDGQTDSNGLLTIDLPWSSLPGVGLYRFRFIDLATDDILHDRSATVPDLASANYEALT